MGKTIRCPKFLCDGIGVPAATRKGFSVGKAIVGNTVGGIVAGVPGAIIGTAAGLNGKKKVTFVCSKCGHTWTEKV